MALVLDRGRGIRAPGPLPEVLSAIGLVDHHAHAVLRAHPTTLDEFRGLFSESRDPAQWPHVATSLSYRRIVAEVAALLDCEPDEEAVFRRRVEHEPADYAALFLRATGTDLLLLDDGFPPAWDAFGLAEMSAIAGCEARPVLRIETRERVGEAVAGARAGGYVGLKSILAYRGGFELERGELPLWEALEANAADPLPVQVHTGFGDADLSLALANPALLKPAIERYPETPFVLLHCYPYIREAGWLAHVYPNVYFDLSLTIPHVSRPAEMVRQAVELAPWSKLLYASDAALTPELYYVAAKWWREGLAEAELPDEAVRAILGGNARALYRL